MKKGITRQYFQEQIQKAVLIAVDDEVKEDIVKDLKKKGYDTGLTTSVLANNHALDTLSMIDLGVFSQQIYEKTHLPMIKPTNFLEEAEIDAVKKHKREVADVDMSDLLVFENVTQLSKDMWTTVVPIQRISALYNNMAVSYDFKTQRQAKHVVLREGIIQTPDVNRSSVEEIRDKLLEYSFVPNTITFNVPIEDGNKIKFDKSKERLTIEDKVLTILDGFHRSLGIIAALQNNPQLEYNFIIVITNFTVDKARQFIVQEDKRNPISKAYLKSIDESDEYTTVVNILNEDSKSELRGKITTNHSLVASGDALVTFEFLHAIIKELWEINSFYDAETVSDFLRSFFNHLISIFPLNSREAEDMYKERMFVVYLIIAKRLYDKDNNYQNYDLEEIISSINSKDIVKKYRFASITDIKKNTKYYIDNIVGVIKGGVSG